MRITVGWLKCLCLRLKNVIPYQSIFELTCTIQGLPLVNKTHSHQTSDGSPLSLVCACKKLPLAPHFGAKNGTQKLAAVCTGGNKVVVVLSHCSHSSSKLESFKKSNLRLVIQMAQIIHRVARFQIFRRLMKRKFDVYVL